MCEVHNYASDPTAGREARVLIVDDDRELCQMLCEYLQAEHFDVKSVHDGSDALAELQAIPRREQVARCEKLMADFHLDKVKHTLGMSLSGGERRRCEMARALVTNPRIMLLDEPFAGVDPKSVMEIQSLIADLKARGIGVLITDHNVRETLQIADRAYILADGMIMKHGLPHEIAEDPDIRRVYVGDNFRLD